MEYCTAMPADGKEALLSLIHHFLEQLKLSGNIPSTLELRSSVLDQAWREAFQQCSPGSSGGQGPSMGLMILHGSASSTIQLSNLPPGSRLTIELSHSQDDGQLPKS